jgi:uncharacterized caspase-like protein
MRWIVRTLAAVVVLAAGMGQAQAPGAKLALVVGVSDYGRERAAQEAAGFVVPPPLANAVRDAELVASALESKGFTVTRVINPDKRALLSSVNAFAAALGRAGPDAVGLFYFAGHGAQGRPALERDIDNYLIPLGADLATEVDLESEALALSRISAALRPAPQGAVVLILDACRDFALPAASRSGLVTRGLAEARAAPGTIIAYATSPGATALDNLPGHSNGPYAAALSAEIRAAQGARLEDVFIGTRNKVLAATRNTQTPWENGSLRRAVTLGVAPERYAAGSASSQTVRAPSIPELMSTKANWRSVWGDQQTQPPQFTGYFMYVGSGPNGLGGNLRFAPGAVLRGYFFNPVGAQPSQDITHQFEIVYGRHTGVGGKIGWARADHLAYLGDIWSDEWVKSSDLMWSLSNQSARTYNRYERLSGPAPR